jgi:hypothetical protein
VSDAALLLVSASLGEAVVAVVHCEEKVSSEPRLSQKQQDSLSSNPANEPRRNDSDENGADFAIVGKTFRGLNLVSRGGFNLRRSSRDHVAELVGLRRG